MTPLDLKDISKLILKMAILLPGLYRRPFCSLEDIQKYQLGHLRKRLADAKKGVTLYQKRGLPDPSEIHNLEDWTQVPLLSKAELLSYPIHERVHSGFKIDELIESKSSGSTGQALSVYYDRESFYYFILAGLRLYQMAFPYRPWHRQTYIYTSPYPLNSLLGLYPMEFISTLTPIPETLKRLRRHPPDLLVCYPSHLRAILDQMTEDDFKRIRPKAINVNSEMSSASERAHMGQKLGAFVFDDYSSEELTRIASQCPSLSYHLFEDINYMEVVDDSGTPLPEGMVGNLIGSNLHNQGMPLLRYQQGDRGAIRSRDCPCGRKFRVLEKLEGRKNDAFLLPDGSELSSGFLLDLTYGVFLNYENAVSSFCLIQNNPACWQLEVVPGSHWSDALARRISEDLMRELRQPSVQIELIAVREVSRTASGKSNPIISKIKKEPI